MEIGIFNNVEELKELKLPQKSILEWQCGNCGKINKDEYRNIFRRNHICSCYKIKEQIDNIKNKLRLKGYEFLDKETDKYTTTKHGLIDTSKTKLPVRCLKCGKTFEAYCGNLISGHKKCDCDLNKIYTLDLSPQEYRNKWTEKNKENFDILDTNYHGRVDKYHIKCLRCGHEDYRSGITLQGQDIFCKSCESNMSKGEREVSEILQKLEIEYIQEYPIVVNNTHRRIDFYLPKYNLAIEYNGLQHYHPIEYFGGEERYEKQKQLDKEKQEYCNKNGIDYLIIPYYYKIEEIEESIKYSLKFNDQTS